MSTYVDKPLSLIERKKAQWAREREELAVLSAPWGLIKDKSENSRARNVANSASTDLFSRRDSNASRRPSLPPIYKNQGQTYTPANDRSDKEMGGETSGYGSDNPNNTPEYLQQSWGQNLGYESSSSARDDRAKWGDRGVGVGKFWEPHEISVKVDDTPGWVKRGLQGETELIVSNTSPAESPEQDYGDQRPYTSSSISQTRTYIRGQNNPVDPVELAEREKRRQLARAHQEAIKQQLEERELRRRDERERKLREEREEELRIEREQEIERKRREHEHDLLMEKQERERKRKEALQQAIELAEQQAREQKLKQKMMRQVNMNISENVAEKEKVVSPRPIPNEDKTKNNFLKPPDEEPPPPTNKPNNVDYLANLPTTNAQINNNINEKKENNINRNRLLTPEPSNLPPQQPPPKPPIPENIVVLQTPYEGFPNMPFAILMPTFNPGPTTPLPITIPMQVNPGADQTPRTRTENRVLTPTQYRNRQFCDSSTQTDYLQAPKSDVEQNKEQIKYVREKLVNLDVNYEPRSRKNSRSRTSERLRDNPGDRPKWGANRPPTRYMKQSEKDPFYQRKKTRHQKVRQIKLYDDKNNNYSPHSSDDSQAVTPRAYRKKGYIEKRRTRALWQKNVQVYQTEIVPLDADKDSIYFQKSDCIKCCCDCRSDKHNYSKELKVVDILKIEHTPRERVQYNTDSKDDSSCLPDCNNSSIDSEVLEKLNSLHTGLMLKQEQWQNSPRTPSLCSPPRTIEINN